MLLKKSNSQIYFFPLTILCYLVSFLFFYTPALRVLVTKSEFILYFFFLFISLLLLNKLNFFSVPGTRIVSILVLYLFTISLILFSSNIYIHGTISLQNTFFIKLFRFYFEAIFGPYILIKFLSVLHNSHEDRMNLLIKICILQSFIALIMLIFPDLKKIIFFDVMKFSSHNKMLQPNVYLQRGFGIASNYLFTMPIFQAIVSCLYFEKTKYKNIFFYLIFVIMILSALTNARISIVIYGFYFLFCFIRSYFSFLNYLKIKISNIIIALLVIILLSILIYQYYTLLETNESFKFILRIFNNEYNVVGILNKMIFFPDEVYQLIFGTGNYIFSNSTVGRNSDIGYIQDLWFGGFHYLLIELLLLIYIFLLINKNVKSGSEKNILNLIVISIPIFHYKGNILSPNEVIKILFFIYYSYLIQKNTTKIKIPKEYYNE